MEGIVSDLAHDALPNIWAEKDTPLSENTTGKA